MKMDDPKALFLIQLRGAGVPPPQVEVPFKGLDGKKRWRFDYAWPDLMVAAEYQGGIYSKGSTGHRTPRGMKNDMHKLNEAMCLGWRVLYINVDTVESGEALQWVEKCLWGER